MTISMLVNLVITNVTVVPIELTIVTNVSHLESMPHLVSVQMVSSTTEIPVSDVTTDVLPVLIEIPAQPATE
jgi:2-oxoglutarate dehydrogenase complex dehydrogenase (E1) component-like enzyme